MHRRARSSAMALPVAVLTTCLTACGGGDGGAAGAQPGGSPEASTAANSAAELLDTQVSGPGFAVRMPGKVKPQRFQAPAKTASGSVRGEVYTYEAGSDAYSVGLFPLAKNDSFNMKGGVQGSADQLGGRIVSQSPLSFRGRPARDAQIVGKQGSQPFTVFVRYVSTSTRVFFLQYIVSGDDFRAVPAEFTAFVATFRLT